MCVMRMITIAPKFYAVVMLGTRLLVAYTPFPGGPTSVCEEGFPSAFGLRQSSYAMARIFCTLATISSLALLAALWLGLGIGDASVLDAIVQSRVAFHFLTALAALVFAVLVHALVLTYFLGTGRWLEETCSAYRLGNEWQGQSRDLKWRLYPAMATSITLLILTGASGGAADPASVVGFTGAGPLSAGQVHLAGAILTLVVNAATNVLEYRALRRNGELVNQVLQEVRRIRVERGLDV